MKETQLDPVSVRVLVTLGMKHRLEYPDDYDDEELREAREYLRSVGEPLPRRKDR